MSSTDESLERHFIEDVKGGNRENQRRVNLEDVIEWFRRIQVFEKMKILESDIRTAYSKLKTKASTISFQDFLNMLSELAKKNNIDVEQLKMQLVNQMETYDNLERQFKDELKKGKANIQDVTDWLNRNQVFDKMKIAEAEVAEVFNQVKKTSYVTYNDLLSGTKQLAAKYNINVEDLMNRVLDPGFLPKTDSTESIEESTQPQNKKK